MKSICLPYSGERSLAFYLAMEEFVAGSFDDDVFFVWQTSPTVIIGRNQDVEAEVNLKYCRENRIRIFRRKSGGGSVYSDSGNIMLSFIHGRGNVQDVFDSYLNALTACLRSLGLNAEKSGRNDVLVDGKKVSGNAFHQLPERSIVHGTLLYSTDLEVLENSLKPPVEKLLRHGIPSVRQRVRNLDQYSNLSGHLADAGSLASYVLGYFTDGQICLSEADLREIETMEKEFEEF